MNSTLLGCSGCKQATEVDEKEKSISPATYDRNSSRNSSLHCHFLAAPVFYGLRARYDVSRSPSCRQSKITRRLGGAFAVLKLDAFHPGEATWRTTNSSHNRFARSS